MGFRTVFCNLIEDIKNDTETFADVLFNKKHSRRHPRPPPNVFYCVGCGPNGFVYEDHPDVIDPSPPYSPPSYSPPPPYSPLSHSPPPPYYSSAREAD
ncbi:hypothetical protein CKAH01_11283 [Colletotrichum kahawae]|uniref:Uncharacterized protein n=1 Tax=Colletotrichum kahawae TaxID=34407 RepID=A0AAD9XUP8_COLKA|nr:hypothetical protein CKAH01_11283 [Colletotrichum kahawae]